MQAILPASARRFRPSLNVETCCCVHSATRSMSCRPTVSRKGTLPKSTSASGRLRISWLEGPLGAPCRHGTVKLVRREASPTACGPAPEFWPKRRAERADRPLHRGRVQPPPSDALHLRCLLKLGNYWGKQV